MIREWQPDLTVEIYVRPQWVGQGYIESVDDIGKRVINVTAKAENIGNGLAVLKTETGFAVTIIKCSAYRLTDARFPLARARKAAKTLAVLRDWSNVSSTKDFTEEEREAIREILNG